MYATVRFVTRITFELESNFILNKNYRVQHNFQQCKMHFCKVISSFVVNLSDSFYSYIRTCLF